MTDPITSQYQQTPWQPTVDTSSSDASDEKKAAAKYDQTYGGSYKESSSPGSSSTNNPYPYPTLSMAYTTAPDLIPLPNTGQSSGSGSVPLADEFTIQLGVLMSSEQSCLDATNEAVQSYQTLSSVVKNAISSNSIFGQIVGSKPDINPDTKVGEILGDGVTYDKLDSEGKNFAAAVIPQMEQLLYSVGNIIEAMGAFTARLNNAGQMYTETDAQSAFPPPGLMEGPNPTDAPS